MSNFFEKLDLVKATVTKIDKGLINDQKYPENFVFQLFIILR